MYNGYQCEKNIGLAIINIIKQNEVIALVNICFVHLPQLLKSSVFLRFSELSYRFP